MIEKEHSGGGRYNTEATTKIFLRHPKVRVAIEDRNVTDVIIEDCPSLIIDVKHDVEEKEGVKLLLFEEESLI